MARVKRTEKGQSARSRYEYLIDRPEAIRKARALIRNCFVYGYKSRADYAEEFGHVLSSQYKYDERIDHWLKGCQHTRVDRKNSEKSIVSVVVAGSEILRNPLYNLFHAKALSERSVAMHFYVTDLLRDGPMSSAALLDAILNTVHEWFPSETYFDPVDRKTLDAFLKSYVSLGILKKEKTLYSLADDVALPPPEALLFAAEQLPLGVVGSYLLDRYDDVPDRLRFKHHYLLGALVSTVLYPLLCAAAGQTPAEVRMERNDVRRTVLPYRFYFGTQTGRQYVLCFDLEQRVPLMLRLDRIASVTVPENSETTPVDRRLMGAYESRLWNISGAAEPDGTVRPRHLEMTLRIEDDEGYVLARLQREKKHGVVEQLEPHLFRFSIDVTDPLEMLPWIRTFTGRIVDLRCPDDPRVVARFAAHLKQSLLQYGVHGNEE